MDLAEVSMTLVLLVLLALTFDFLNGFHDAANSIATVVSTGVLKPWQAVLWAAFFNVLAWGFFHLSVAATVGKGIIDPAFVDDRVIFGALIGAISWNLITWYYGIPSSSSHALIGGMMGSAFTKAGATPMLGAVITLLLSWLFLRQTPRLVDRAFRRLQLVSSAAYSMGHGGNDAQKTMGIIWLLLIANGVTTEDHLPTWVVMSCFLAIGLGTMFGGWRIVKTMGQRITKLRPVGGFAAEAAGSITLFMATHFGIPVSTTHTITGAIIGVGTTKGSSAVRWAVAGNIVIAWIVTIPASAAIAGLAWWVGGVLL
jgi:PiT family inorganic phosphate transporter